jgi:hypothetical protein
MVNEAIKRVKEILHNRLHRTLTTQTTHNRFRPSAIPHTVENTWRRNCFTDFEPEGREFESLRARHFQCARRREPFTT